MLRKHTKTINYGLTKNVCLFVNARDEYHIKEWVTHHLLIGFDFICIFDNKSNKSLLNEFKNFDKRVKIIDASDMDGAIKIPLMNRASTIAKLFKFDWMIYLDADEYIILSSKFIGIKHFLNHYNNAHSLGINWLLFGSNNLINEPAELQIDSYTKSEINLNSHVKSFARPKEITFADNPHFYHIKNKEKMFGINGINISTIPTHNNINIPFYKAPIYIAHYVNQSQETFLKRKGFPRDDTGTYREINDQTIKNLHNEFNDVDNLYPKNKYSENIKAFLQNKLINK